MKPHIYKEITVCGKIKVKQKSTWNHQKQFEGEKTSLESQGDFIDKGGGRDKLAEKNVQQKKQKREKKQWKQQQKRKW